MEHFRARRPLHALRGLRPFRQGESSDWSDGGGSGRRSRGGRRGRGRLRPSPCAGRTKRGRTPPSPLQGVQPCCICAGSPHVSTRVPSSGSMAPGAAAAAAAAGGGGLGRPCALGGQRGGEPSLSSPRGAALLHLRGFTQCERTCSELRLNGVRLLPRLAPRLLRRRPPRSLTKAEFSEPLLYGVTAAAPPHAPASPAAATVSDQG